ncbi:Uncharacterised protein [uncultured archaeon]|nr:Uncharacterised protein [uncultured archaeon]
MVVSLSPLLTVMPVVAFLFVFILIYALLMKTQVLGDNKFVALFLSLIVAVFFIVNTQLVSFVQINVSWFVVFAVCLFLIFTFVGLAGKDALKEVSTHKGVAWMLLGILIIVFVVSSSYVFNWVLNWDMIKGWFDQPWFGTVLLAIVAFFVARVLIGVKK